MKLFLLTLLHSVFTVSGMGLINAALGGKPLNVRDLSEAVLTPLGILGVILLFGSFIVTSVILSFARLSVFVPLSTGLVFLVTLLYAVWFQDEKVNIVTTLGMVLIVIGVAVVSGQSSK